MKFHCNYNASLQINIDDQGQTRVNMTGTDQKISTQATRGRSGPVRYELVRADGVVSPMKFDTAAQAVEAAGYLWPGQQQDEDRTGKGWDVQVAGCEQ